MVGTGDVMVSEEAGLRRTKCFIYSLKCGI
jgi:hypothetical protein